MDETIKRSLKPEIVLANYARFDGRRGTRLGPVKSRMFLWSKGGQGTVTINEQRFQIQPFEYFVIPWHHMIRYEPDPEIPFHLAGIHLVPWHDPAEPFAWKVAHHPDEVLFRVPWRQDRRIKGLDHLLKFRLTQDHPLVQLSEYIVQHFIGSHRSRPLLQRCAYTLLEEARYTASARPAHPRDIELLERFIQDNLSHPIGVRDLAGTLGRSPSHVTRLCRRHLKLTPGNWINSMKVRYACDQLRSTRLSVAEIAARSGFADPFYFSRLFKKQTGLSPLKYRRKQPLI